MFWFLFLNFSISSPTTSEGAVTRPCCQVTSAWCFGGQQAPAPSSANPWSGSVTLRRRTRCLCTQWVSGWRWRRAGWGSMTSVWPAAAEWEAGSYWRPETKGSRCSTGSGSRSRAPGSWATLVRPYVKNECHILILLLRRWICLARQEEWIWASVFCPCHQAWILSFKQLSV